VLPEARDTLALSMFHLLVRPHSRLLLIFPFVQDLVFAFLALLDRRQIREQSMMDLGSVEMTKLVMGADRPVFDLELFPHLLMVCRHLPACAFGPEIYLASGI
jgi:hypothetical protein